jgi:hypothetical protein
MKKDSRPIQKSLRYTIKLPDGEKITIGSGISNVRTSSTSVSETDIPEMIKAARVASKAGVFDEEKNEYGNLINFYAQ